ncbi:MAG: imidazoleglycerol-phosphate dehydratase [Planctomycetes bacterium]|nr:imidazoleglycerol-phosphate dehydratase [Planctomycetota bacterium]
MPRKARKAALRRETRETRIEVELQLDGSGRSRVECADAFLKHMLETLARFAGFDLRAKASGDDAHHISEDLAITLGRALRQALGDAAIRRIGSALVPMDEALTQVAVDLVDRPFCDAPVPGEQFVHFLRSLAIEGRFTLHVQVLRGSDAHHVVEATFKALGLALREAVTPVAGEIRSTKGRPTLGPSRSRSS